MYPLGYPSEAPSLILPPGEGTCGCQIRQIPSHPRQTPARMNEQIAILRGHRGCRSNEGVGEGTCGRRIRPTSQTAAGFACAHRTLTNSWELRTVAQPSDLANPAHRIGEHAQIRDPVLEQVADRLGFARRSATSARSFLPRRP